MPYDRQVIVQLEFDGITNRSSTALSNYGNGMGIPTELVQVRRANGREGFNPMDVAKLTKALSRLTRNSRVYLDGHGDWQSQHLGDYDADTLAGLLINCGLPPVKVISVLGCECGRDMGTTNNVRVSNSMDSFGSKFHKALRDKGGLKLVVYARIYCVAVGNPDVGSGTTKPELRGHKGTFNKNDDWDSWDKGKGSHRTRSKLCFDWVGNTQRRTWAY